MAELTEMNALLGNVHVASYGGGRNSKWLIAKWVSDGNPLHIVLFADTGCRRDKAEKLETYQEVEDFREWLMFRGVPCQTVYVTGESLYENCIRRGTVPAIAFGWRTCSQRWKIEPQEKFLNNWIVTRRAWARGEKVVKLIGFHAGEMKRAKPYEDDKYINRYWLVELGHDGEDCAEGLISLGLSVPPKSACHYCPETKQREIVKLSTDNQASALFMEANALPNLTKLKGVNRKYSWASVIDGTCEVPDSPERDMPCGCIDGG